MAGSYLVYKGTQFSPSYTCNDCIKATFTVAVHLLTFNSLLSHFESSDSRVGSLVLQLGSVFLVLRPCIWMLKLVWMSQVPADVQIKLCDFSLNNDDKSF